MRPLNDRRPPRQRSSGSGRILLIVGGVLLSSCFLCCGGGLFVGWWGSEQDKKKLAEANRQWDAGQKADAVAAYKSLIERDSKYTPDDAERPTVYQRVIEYDLERGDTASAKAVVEKALDRKVELPAGNKPMAELVAQVRVEREKRAADEVARRAADEKRKEEERAAEANRKEEDREAEAKRKDEKREAEAKQKVEQQAAKEKLSEDEKDVNGLVLLKKTINGMETQFGGEITGTVVNRTGKKLKYAQITFNLYDASGAQVGSALANINGLEPGGRWNFKASSLGTKFQTYKFSELSGF